MDDVYVPVPSQQLHHVTAAEGVSRPPQRDLPCNGRCG
ncbi:hypothetical protein FHR67_003782 [Xanthomonas arboricola]|nr:hypothetical protein [Xanthomonas campestris]